MKKKQQTAAAAHNLTPEGAQRFLELVEPVEHASGGCRLREPGLSWCVACFLDDAEEFEHFTLDAMTRGDNPLALLCEMVKPGHLSEAARLLAAARAVAA